MRCPAQMCWSSVPESGSCNREHDTQSESPPASNTLYAIIKTRILYISERYIRIKVLNVDIFSKRLQHIHALFNIFQGRRRRRTSIVSASESNHLGNAYMHQKNTILPCTEQILTTEDYENERQQRLSTKVLPKLRLLDLRGTSITPEYASLIAAVFPDVEVMRFQSKLSSEVNDLLPS